MYETTITNGSISLVVAVTANKKIQNNSEMGKGFKYLQAKVKLTFYQISGEKKVPSTAYIAETRVRCVREKEPSTFMLRHTNKFRTRKKKQKHFQSSN